MEGLNKFLSQVADYMYYGVIGILIVLAVVALFFWKKEKY